MVPLSLILRKVRFHYEFVNKKIRINLLLCMDDLKLFAKSNDQINSLVNTVYLFSDWMVRMDILQTKRVR